MTSSDYARFGNFAFCTAAYAAAGIIGDPRVSAYHNRTVFRAYGNGAMRGSTNGYIRGALQVPALRQPAATPLPALLLSVVGQR